MRKTGKSVKPDIGKTDYENTGLTFLQLRNQPILCEKSGKVENYRTRHLHCSDNELWAGQDRDELSNEDESAYKDRLRGCCTEERERVGVEDVIVSVVT